MTTATINILLVDDEAAHAEAIRRTLEGSTLQAVIRVVGTLAEFRAEVARTLPQIALVMNSAQKQLGLVNDILALARSDSEGVALEKEAFPLRQAVNEAVKSRPSSGTRGSHSSSPSDRGSRSRPWGMRSASGRSSSRCSPTPSSSPRPAG